MFPGRATRTFESQEETRILERHQQRQCLSAFGLSIAIILAPDTYSEAPKEFAAELGDESASVLVGTHMRIELGVP